MEHAVVHVHNDDDDEEDPADALLRRGQQLRYLRELERKDEEERQKCSVDNANSTAEEQGGNRNRAVKRMIDGKEVFLYDEFFLSTDQRYYDDLKHVDYKFIDFGRLGETTATTEADEGVENSSQLVIEQDKSLGKGGLCWDAAFILGEFLIDKFQTTKIHGDDNNNNTITDDHPTAANNRRRRIIELGSGTGLCGLMLAKGAKNVDVLVTDLPQLMPLMERNVARNFGAAGGGNNGESSEVSQHITSRNQQQSRCGGTAKATILSWGDQAQIAQVGSFHIIIGADIVATLYDPVCLAQTIYDLCSNDDDQAAQVIISFKERLSSVHRLFEGAMEERFECVEIQPPPPNRRNKNPDVQFLIARGKRSLPLRIEQNHMTEKGQVKVQRFGHIAAEVRSLPSDWPCGEEILTRLRAFDIATTTSTTATRRPSYWQACARYAMLRQYGLTKGRQYRQSENGSYSLSLSDEDIHAINEDWVRCPEGNELYELMETSMSNQRLLQWSLMSCGPACQFQLHAHPNIELVYCISGALHELRMEGEALPVSPDATGPSLTQSKRSWSFGTLSQGRWLVNEVGSVHKSFTATNEGCILLVLWGGGHANIKEQPRSVDIQGAVDSLVKQLHACSCGETTIVQQVFLPGSEKSETTR